MQPARLAFFAAVCASLLFAHPMGNFSVNHYARIVPHNGGADISYVIDLAEIPTFELLQKWNLQASSPQAALQSRAVDEARNWVRNLTVSIGGSKVQPKFEGAQMTLTDGVGGMKVMRVEVKVAVNGGAGKLVYVDRNYPERTGWKEVVIGTGPDRSQALTAYPTDPAVPQPQDVRASVEIQGSGPVVAQVAPTAPVPAPLAVPEPPPVGQPQAEPKPAPTAATPAQTESMGSLKRGDYLSTVLHGGDITFGVGLACLLVAFGLGALHAFEPGHGKTMVAAYLVGSRGTPRHAVLLGLMTTFTHTVSVFLLGFVTLFLSRYIMPEKMTKVLGVVSGLSIVWIGGIMLYRRSRKLIGTHTNVHHHDHHHHDHPHAHEHAAVTAHSHHEHSHGHGHEHSHDHHHEHDAHSHSPASHSHHDHSHDHGHSHDHDHAHHHVPEGDITMGSLIALGASGGMVPCPAALILLLTCISLGRPGFGMMLLLSFSVGLAIVLMATGLVVLFAKNLVPERHRNSQSPLIRALPVISAAVIVVIGLVMTGVSLGWLPAVRFFG
jgi:nickel/cobalt exporter